MDLSINKNCKLYISDVPAASSEETTLVLIQKKDESAWSVHEYSEFGIDIESDGWYLCYVKNFSKDSLKELKLDTLADATKAFSDVIGIDFFSISHLRNCVLELEKQTLLNYDANSCKKSGSNSDREIRDILMIAIFVLENLICDREKYVKAAHILEGLSNIECSLCKNPKTLCNCNE